MPRGRQRQRAQSRHIQTIALRWVARPAALAPEASKGEAMFEDLRGYLSYLEEQGQLLRISEEVDVKYEIAAGIRKTSDVCGPALLFESIKGFAGWRVLGGLFATLKLVALGLGVSEEQLLERYLTLEEKRIPPEMVQTGPVKEICWRGGGVGF